MSKRLDVNNIDGLFSKQRCHISIDNITKAYEQKADKHQALLGTKEFPKHPRLERNPFCKRFHAIIKQQRLTHTVMRGTKKSNSNNSKPSTHRYQGIELFISSIPPAAFSLIP